VEYIHQRQSLIRIDKNIGAVIDLVDDLDNRFVIHHPAFMGFEIGWQNAYKQIGAHQTITPYIGIAILLAIVEAHYKAIPDLPKVVA